MVDISIAIVAYNNYRDISNALRTLEEFTSSTLKKKVFLLDNSAADETFKNDRDTLLQQASEYGDVIYADMGSNLGFGKANNYVLGRINSKFHVIMNPDIVFVEDALTKIISYMDTNNVGMCIPKIITENGELQSAYRREVTLWDMFIRFFCKNLFKKRVEYHTLQDLDYSKPFRVPFGQGSFLVIKTELFQELNGFDDRFFMYMEDADLCKRVNEISKLMYYPHATVVHKWEKGSHKSMKLFEIHLISMIKYFSKWGVRFY